MAEDFELDEPRVQTELAVVTTNRSAQVGELMIALAKAQGEYDKAVKDSNNPYYGSKYADLASITGAVRGAFSKHGIAIVQTVTADLERQTAGATTFLYFGEQWISTTCELPAVGKSKDGKDRFDAQTIGAAQTYARRYTLAPLASVAPEDDDANTIVRDDARRFGKPVSPQQAGVAPPIQQQPNNDSVAQDGTPAMTWGVFVAKGKELSWGLGDIQNYVRKTHPGVKRSGDLTAGQMEAALLVFSKVKPTGEVQGESPETA